MGQYWKAINLDKREFIMPHKLGSGLKLWEIIANGQAGVGVALVILAAAMPEARGGGDLDLDRNWHGPERTFPEHNTTPGPMPPAYQEIAARTIGRWAGDRIALIGDYAEDTDLKQGAVQGGRQIPTSMIYELCNAGGHSVTPDTGGTDQAAPPFDAFTDITDDVCAVIEHELNGKFEGDGWRHFVRKGDTASKAE